MREGASGVGAVHTLCSEGKLSADRAPSWLSPMALLLQHCRTPSCCFRNCLGFNGAFLEEPRGGHLAGGARADKHTKVSGRKHLSVELSRINSSPWLPFRLDLLVCLRLRPGPDWPWVTPRSRVSGLQECPVISHLCRWLRCF